MGEPVLSRCPTCGLQIQADPAQGSIKCLGCGQTFTVSDDPGAAPSAPAQKMPRVGLILLIALDPIVISAISLYAAFNREDEPSFATVQDYLAQPGEVPERVRSVGDELRRLEISRTGLEVYDAQGQRHTMSGSGRWLRRGGAVPVPAETFTVDEIDFDELPELIVAAGERSGARVSEATVEVRGGEPVWVLRVFSDTGAGELVYSLDGEYRPQSNVRSN